MPDEKTAPATPTEDEIRAMSEDELLKLSGQTPAEAPPAAPTGPPAAPPGDTGKGTPPEDTLKKEDAGTAEPTPEGAGDKPTAPPDPAAKADEPGLFAGKYKSAEDLVTGITEIAKKLGYPYDSLASRLIESAKGANDYKALADEYKRYEEALGKKAAASTEQPTAAPPNTADEAKVLQETKAAVADLFRERLGSHSVVQQFTRAGVAVPQNAEELDELYQTNPRLAHSYTLALQEVKASVATVIEEQGRMKAELPGLLERAVTEAKADVKAMNEKYGFGLTDAEVDVVVAEGMKNLADPLIYEDRHGFSVPRAHGFARWFRAEKLEGMVERVRLAGESAGRKKHLEDLEKMKGKTHSSIGTAPVPHRKVETETRKPDLRDPDQVRGLTEEQLLATLK